MEPQVPDRFERLRTSVRERGWFALDEDESGFGPRLICVAKKRPAGGYTGTSFWIAVKDQNYVIAGFGRDCWLIPNADDFVSVGIDWLHLECGVGNPPDSLISRYGLRKLTDAELVMMFETYIPAVLKAIFHAQERCYKAVKHHSEGLSDLTRFGDRAFNDTIGDVFEVSGVVTDEDWEAIAANPETGESYMIDSSGTLNRRCSHFASLVI